MLGVQRIQLLLPKAAFEHFVSRWTSSFEGRLVRKEFAKLQNYSFFGGSRKIVALDQKRGQFLPLERVVFWTTPFFQNIKSRILSSSPQSPFKSAMEVETEVVSPSRSKDMVRHPAEKLSSMIQAIPLPLRSPRMAPADQAFLLLACIALMVSGALFALLATAIPTLNAMRRAALSLEKLADSAREELPGTMAAIRLSGIEISDLTLELSDLSQDISEGIRSSARAVQAAGVGIQRIRSFAVSQTLSMLQERANMPVEAVKPVVATAAETTWQAVTQAQRVVVGLAALPLLSKWIQKKNIEERKKIEEDMEGAVSVFRDDSTKEVSED